MEQREEGGSNSFVWQLPTRMKFSNIKVSRPVSRRTPQIMAWLADMFVTGVRTTNAKISARTFDNTVVAAWTLTGVVPVKWTGPSLTLDSPKVAMETLELAHHGISAEVPK
jgi:phage tail-like protein